jgi:hypothetical protein
MSEIKPAAMDEDFAGSLFDQVIAWSNALKTLHQ